MSTRRIVLGLVATAISLVGCANFSGLGGDSKYACKAPEGVACDSVSGTYANALQNNLPGQRQQAQRQPASDSVAAPPSAMHRVPLIPLTAVDASNGSPQPAATVSLRSPARILRLWTKPWEDADGDLYDQGYVYVQVSAGQWLIDHVQRQIRDAFAPLRPPATSSGSRDTDPDAAASTQPAPLRPPSGNASSPTPMPGMGLPAGIRNPRAP